MLLAYQYLNTHTQKRDENEKEAQKVLHNRKSYISVHF